MFAHIVIGGRLVRDPELRQTGNGTNVSNITIAATTDFKTDEASFFDVTLWGKLAEIVVAHKKKGDVVIVEVKIRQERFQQDGQNRSKFVTTANSVSFVPGGNNDSSDGNDNTDIPF